MKFVILANRLFRSITRNRIIPITKRIGARLSKSRNTSLCAWIYAIRFTIESETVKISARYMINTKIKGIVDMRRKYLLDFFRDN